MRLSRIDRATIPPIPGVLVFARPSRRDGARETEKRGGVMARELNDVYLVDACARLRRAGQKGISGTPAADDLVVKVIRTPC